MFYQETGRWKKRQKEEKRERHGARGCEGEEEEVEEGEKRIENDENMAALRVALPNQTSLASDMTGRSDTGRPPHPELENRIEIEDRYRDRIEKETPHRTTVLNQTRETIELQSWQSLQGQYQLQWSLFLQSLQQTTKKNYNKQYQQYQQYQTP